MASEDSRPTGDFQIPCPRCTRVQVGWGMAGAVKAMFDHVLAFHAPPPTGSRWAIRGGPARAYLIERSNDGVWHDMAACDSEYDAGKILRILQSVEKP